MVAAVTRFRLQGDPMKTMKCPVCDWEIKDQGIKVQAGGQEVTVCCDDCAKTVTEDPAKYAGTTK